MKISQILYSGLGGHGSVVFSLIKGDEKNEWNNNLIFYGIENTLEEYLNRCETLDINHKSIIKRAGFDLTSWKRLYMSLKKQRPDAVLLHNVGVLLPVLTYCFFNRSKLVLVEHTPIISKSSKEWVFTHLAMLFVKKIVVLSQTYKSQLLKKTLSLNPSKVEVIPNGIDIIFFQPTKEKKTIHHFSLGMISRLSPEKDHLTLIKAVKLLSEKYPNMTLKIAGEGEMKEEINKVIYKLGLQNQVELVGLLNQAEILSMMNSIDIYVHSSYSEAMSTSIMQALSCGKPVIAANIEGVSNLVSDRSTGILFEPINEKSLADKISYYFENTSMKTQAGTSARLFAIENLSCNQMFKSYSKLLNKSL